MKELDTVKLLIETSTVEKGSIGTIVEVWEKDKSYEVEFLDKDGFVIDCICVTAKNLELVKEY